MSVWLHAAAVSTLVKQHFVSEAGGQQQTAEYFAARDDPSDTDLNFQSVTDHVTEALCNIAETRVD